MSKQIPTICHNTCNSFFNYDMLWMIVRYSSVSIQPRRKRIFFRSHIIKSLHFACSRKCHCSGCNIICPSNVVATLYTTVAAICWQIRIGSNNALIFKRICFFFCCRILLFVSFLYFLICSLKRRLIVTTKALRTVKILQCRIINQYFL